LPTADDITVREALDKLDGEFSRVAEAVANGEFALWIGSGISRKAPSLGGLIDLAIDYLRSRAVDAATRARFLPALEEALELAEVDPATVAGHFATPFKDWPNHGAIQTRLWNKYSRLLDVRVAGENSDFILWDAIDIRAAFERPIRPAAEHVCIAILVMEGAVKEMASANWDGFIEEAVKRLTGGAGGVLQAIVDPNHLRSAAGAARLLKFHGCIVHATDEPATFRDFLTGSHTQILEWATKPLFSAMRAAVTSLAANHKSLVMGLSIQDANLQGVFSAAKQANPWPWPPDPNAQGHVFCQEAITMGQRDVLKLIYGDVYNTSTASIVQSAHLRAWAEQVLIALVFHVLEKKLTLLMKSALETAGKGGLLGDMSALLKELRNDVADLSVWDPVDKSRTDYAYAAITIWSRIIAVFRTGKLPANPDEYQAVSASGLKQLAADNNALAAGLGHFAMALSMLQHGKDQALWTLGRATGAGLENGSIRAIGSWDGATERPIFIVKGVTEALNLQQSGAFSNDNAIVVHADDAWARVGGAATTARRVSGAPGRTGRSRTRHVCIQGLLDRCDSADELKNAFVAEASI
jgi:hypothetical protein